MQVLVHYYTGVHVRDANGTNLTRECRWDPLQINWGTPNNQPPVMYHGSAYQVAITVQNTSIYDWSPSGQWRLSYHWAKAGVGERDSNNWSGTNRDVPRGDPPYTFSLTINDISDWGPGVYTLKFDMIDHRWGYNNWFSTGYYWPTYDVSLCVDHPCQVLPILMKNYAGW